LREAAGPTGTRCDGNIPDITLLYNDMRGNDVLIGKDRGDGKYWDCTDRHDATAPITTPRERDSTPRERDSAIEMGAVRCVMTASLKDAKRLAVPRQPVSRFRTLSIT
jgi:hypothetical protein